MSFRWELSDEAEIAVEEQLACYESDESTAERNSATGGLKAWSKLCPNSRELHFDMAWLQKTSAGIQR